MDGIESSALDHAMEPLRKTALESPLGGTRCRKMGQVHIDEQEQEEEA